MSTLPARRVAVFGGTGFVGAYVVEALLDAGFEPALLVREGSEGKVVASERCRIVSGDITMPAAVNATLEGAQAAIYLIGILKPHASRGITFEEIHYSGAVRAAEATRAVGARRFILMSANGVTTQSTPYQQTKMRAEEYAAESRLRFTIFRPSVIFGDPRGRMEIATQLYRQMIRPPLPAVGFFSGWRPSNGPVLMSPVHVEDVACAFVRAIDDASTEQRRIALGGPEVLSWTEMLRRIAAAAGKQKLVVPMPIPAMKLAAAMLDWLPFFPVTRDQLTMLAEGNTANPDQLAALIDREPRRFSTENLAYLRG